MENNENQGFPGMRTSLFTKDLPIFQRTFWKDIPEKLIRIFVSYWFNLVWMRRNLLQVVWRWDILKMDSSNIKSQMGMTLSIVVR